ncbi:uncharacterized protein PG998_013798 [Apiospora kogelbergensis]|uniref:uncharacterized protein n=1 Tax=Apiospora kogelbergensis TaxID=1337665 RepID=UPI00312E5A2A
MTTASVELSLIDRRRDVRHGDGKRSAVLKTTVGTDIKKDTVGLVQGGLRVGVRTVVCTAHWSTAVFGSSNMTETERGADSGLGRLLGLEGEERSGAAEDLCSTAVLGSKAGRFAMGLAMQRGSAREVE